MKARNLIFAGFVFAAASGFAQSIDSSIHVNQFPGSTVAAKLTNAMATCPTNVQVPCILVLDPSLAPMTSGAFPSLCSHCYLSDYRNGPLLGACGANPCPIAAGGTSAVNAAQAIGNLAKGAGEGIWKRKGVVDYGSAGTYILEEPTVIADTNPQLLTGNSYVYKKWASYGTSIGYAESVDGIQWTQGGVVIPNHYRSSVSLISGTYYFWGKSSGANHIDIYSSANGYTGWTDVCPAALPTATAPFSQSDLENSSEIVYGGTLYLFVEVPGGIGIYTSTVGSCTYTAVSLISYTAASYAAGPTNPFLINGTWYMWGHAECPASVGEGIGGTCIGRMSAPALTGPWSFTGVTEISPRTLDEGPGVGPGQVADPSILPDISAGIPPDPTKGKTLLYYTASQYYNSTYKQVTKLAVADMPMSSVVQTQGGDDLGEIENPGLLGQSFDYTNQAINENGFGVENLAGFVTIYNPLGSGTAEIKALADGNSQVDLGCSTAATGANQCSNGNLLINLNTASSGTPYNASLAVASGGGQGITFKLPRNVGTGGYYLNDAANANLAFLESTTGNFATTKGSISASPASGDAMVKANSATGNGYLEPIRSAGTGYALAAYFTGATENWYEGEYGDSNYSIGVPGTGVLFYISPSAPYHSLTVDSSGNVAVAGGTNVVYRCVTAGATLPVGSLTINSGACGSTADIGLRVK